jgi:hypothetical protein
MATTVNGVSYLPFRIFVNGTQHEIWLSEATFEKELRSWINGEYPLSGYHIEPNGKHTQFGHRITMGKQVGPMAVVYHPED